MTLPSSCQCLSMCAQGHAIACGWHTRLCSAEFSLYTYPIYIEGACVKRQAWHPNAHAHARHVPCPCAICMHIRVSWRIVDACPPVLNRPWRPSWISSHHSRRASSSLTTRRLPLFATRSQLMCTCAGGWRGGATYARALLTIKATCWMVVVAQDVVCMGIAWGGVHIVAQREACTYPPNKYSINPAPPQLHPTAPHPTALR